MTRTKTPGRRVQAGQVYTDQDPRRRDLVVVDALEHPYARCTRYRKNRTPTTTRIRQDRLLNLRLFILVAGAARKPTGRSHTHRKG